MTNYMIIKQLVSDLAQFHAAFNELKPVREKFGLKDLGAFRAAEGPAIGIHPSNRTPRLPIVGKRDRLHRLRELPQSVLPEHERRSLRRIDDGTLSEDEVERLGKTFMALEERMDELRNEFGLDPEDLNLNLGPLGNLL